MKARVMLAALASGTLALGLLAPVGVSAAPEALKPTGKAMIRIEGGTARAIERGDLLYRIVVPQGATIKWLGDSDRGWAIGTLGRKGLIAGWTRLGHSARGAHAMTTITWQEPGEDRPHFVGAYVGLPKMNSEGAMTFLARTIDPLPETLPSFTLNIARATPDVPVPTVRGSYPVVFPVNTADDTVGARATATSDTTATIDFVTLTKGAVTGICDKPTSKSLSPSADYVNFGGTCQEVTWSGGLLQFTPIQSPTTTAQIWMSATILVKGVTTTTFGWNFNMAQWKSGGTVVWPV